MKRDLGLYFEDILESINLIEKYIERYNYFKFKDDVQLIDSVIRRTEVIGEAVRNIPKRFRDKQPEILWDSYVKSRNFLAHVYFGINYSRLWKFVKEDLPVLKKAVVKLLEEYDGK